MQGKAQIITNPHMERPGDLVFYLDGAHSPESMDMCGRGSLVLSKRISIIILDPGNNPRLIQEKTPPKYFCSILCQFGILSSFYLDWSVPVLIMVMLGIMDLQCQYLLHKLSIKCKGECCTHQ